MKNINQNKAKQNNLRSSLKKIRVPANKSAKIREPEKIILEFDTLYVGNLSEDINEIDLFGPRTTNSVTPLMSKYHFLKILGNEEALLM